MNTFWDKYGTMVLGGAAMLLNLALAAVNQKNSDIKMKEAVEECVKETLKSQAKGS